jgi:hypothetical protein
VLQNKNWSKCIQSIVEHLNTIFRPFGKNYELRNRKPRFTAAFSMFPREAVNRGFTVVVNVRDLGKRPVFRFC